MLGRLDLGTLKQCVALIILIAGCARFSAWQRYARGADTTKVRVVESVPSEWGCSFLRELTASDGCHECGAPFEGQYDRAVNRLKNRVLLAGGNTLVLSKEVTESLTTHKLGSKVVVSGSAHYCTGGEERDATKPVRPNIPTSQRPNRLN